MKTFADLSFDDDFLFAIRADGSRITFSKRERALLGVMAARRDTLFTRDQLLDHLSDGADAPFDRNIDSVISRLRRKLGDSSVQPGFIATRYGEGYVWVAREGVGATPQVAVETAFVKLLCPLWEGHAQLTGPENRAFLECLGGEVQAKLGDQHRLIIAAGGDARQADEKRMFARFTVQVAFVTLREVPQLSLTLYDNERKSVIRVIRRPLGELSDCHDLFHSMAGELYDCMVAFRLLNGPEDEAGNREPHTVTLYRTSKLFNPHDETQSIAVTALRQSLSQNPGNPTRHKVSKARSNSGTWE